MLRHATLDQLSELKLHGMARAFEEQLEFGKSIPADWHKLGIFQIDQRLFHPRFNAWPGERADIGCISRLGASHCLISHDWQGSRRHLQGYVTSPIFPEAIDPHEVDKNQEGLRHLIENCRDHGLDCALWLTELPCQGGPWVADADRQVWLERFPAGVLSDSGTYQGKVLCFSHPDVQAFYRDLIERFFSKFPEVETLFLFGMDSGGACCDPEHCPRCRGLSRFEQRDRLIRFLIDEGNRVRPGLRVLTTGWHWERYPEEFLERQARLPAASGVFLAAECDGWQVERQNHDFLRSVRDVCRERGQLFIGYDNFHLGDDATHLWGIDIQDFPLGIGAKMARWHDLEVDGVFDHWGACNRMVPTNSIACREFFLDPQANPENVGRRLAIRQYGPKAGRLAFQAWKAIEEAHRILSDCCTWCPGQWPGWYAGKGEAPLPDFLSGQSEVLEATRLVPKPTVGFAYNEGTLADCLERVGNGWHLAVPHLAEACRQLDAALAVADPEVPVGYAFWWTGEAASPRRREHLARHKLYVEFMMTLGREIGIQFSLHAAFERLGRDANAYLANATPQLRDDLDACRAVVALIDGSMAGFPEMRKSPPARWRDAYLRKIRQLEERCFDSRLEG